MRILLEQKSPKASYVPKWVNIINELDLDRSRDRKWTGTLVYQKQLGLNLELSRQILNIGLL